MPTLQDTMRRAMLNAFNTTINTGAGTASILVRSSSNTTIATLSLADPAFSSSSASGVPINLQSVPVQDTSAAKTHKITDMALYDKDSNLQVVFTVSSTGADINFSGSDLQVASADTVELTSLQVNLPAS